MKFGASQFTNNSPAWAKRLRIAIMAMVALIIANNDLLAPLVGMEIATFDKWVGIGGGLSAIVFNFFGVDAEPNPKQNA